MSRFERVFLTLGLLSGLVFGSPHAEAGLDLIAPTLAPPPHHILKNRYISIQPNAESFNPPSHHIRVTLQSSQVNGVNGSGPWWAGDPNANCISLVTTQQPEFEPFWNDCPVVHLTGCPFIPTSTYDIVIVLGAEESFPLQARTQAKPGVKWWGDVVGHFDGTKWTSPNGVVNTNDVVAAIKTFQNPNAMAGCGTPPCNATHISVTDLYPALDGNQINQIVGIADVFMIILGFQGREYPGTDLEQCP